MLENLKNQRGGFELTTSISIFLVCLIIALSVAAFHHWYFPSKYIQYKSNEVASLFDSSENFPKKAKDILNSRQDVSYLKLLDRDGLVIHSFGNQDSEKSEKYIVNVPGDKTIILGVKHLEYNQIDGYSLLWSFIIGSVISLILLIVIFLITPAPDQSLRRLLDTMKKINEGDLSGRLPITPSVKSDSEIFGLYSEFNKIAASLENNMKIKAEPENITVSEDKKEEKKPEVKEENKEKVMSLAEAEIVEEGKKLDIKTEPEKKPSDENENIDIIQFDEDQQDEMAVEEDKDDNFSLFAEEETKKPIVSRTIKKIEKKVEKIKETKSGIARPFRPKIVYDNSKHIPKNRNVTVLVAKISDFANLAIELEPSDLNAFITKYRSSASAIITDYGGSIETMLRDEIVAVFNSPQKQEKPELKSVCAAVKIMQLVADLTRRRKSEGKKLITAKIGIGVDSVPFKNESPDGARINGVISSVKIICNNSANWKILVSSDFYGSIKEFVDVKEEKINNNSYYSITGVEESVANY